MNDRGGRGQQLMMRQEIYFRSSREHNPKYPVFTRIFRQAHSALLHGIRPHTAYQPSRTTPCHHR
jgi:hypothetical protein